MSRAPHGSALSGGQGDLRMDSVAPATQGEGTKWETRTHLIPSLLLRSFPPEWERGPVIHRAFSFLRRNVGISRQIVLASCYNCGMLHG